LHFTCPTGHKWEVPFEVAMKAAQQFCPTCGTPAVVLQPSVFGWGKGRWGRKHSDG